MCSGVSSFNTFLQEYDSDSGSEDASGVDDSNFSNSSSFERGDSQRRRGRNPLWKRSLRKVFSPFRALYVCSTIFMIALEVPFRSLRLGESAENSLITFVR